MIGSTPEQLTANRTIFFFLAPGSTHKSIRVGLRAETVAAFNVSRTNAPLVSVITPVFNGAEFLTEALRSVQNQTLRDWEHILVDDGSTDGSSELIEEAAAADSRVRLLRTRERCGPAKARNQGLGCARGKYVAFLDAD